jgi:uncharacterized protein with HEPN domain
MSDATSPREWRFYVEDMITFCDKALDYTRGLDRSTFGADPMRYDATLRNLQLIGKLLPTYPSTHALRQPMSRGEWSSRHGIA